jgi:hypothetical protein
MFGCQKWVWLSIVFVCFDDLFQFRIPTSLINSGTSSKLPSELQSHTVLLQQTAPAEGLVSHWLAGRSMGPVTYEHHMKRMAVVMGLACGKKIR